MALCGLGLLDALEKIKDAALNTASRSLGVAAAELHVESRGVSHKNEQARLVSWSELARLSGGQLSAIGDGHNPPGQIIDPASGSQRGPVDFMDASHGCDLAIHPETGHVRILKYVACHDAGRVLNYEAARGQVIGGAVMGLGQALFEKITVHEGKVVNTGFRDYLVPTALDTAEELEVELLESGSGIGPGGAKGMGESGAVASPIAIANAIYDALGTQLSVIPVTPEDLVALAQASNPANATAPKI